MRVCVCTFRIYIINYTNHTDGWTETTLSQKPHHPLQSAYVQRFCFLFHSPTYRLYIPYQHIFFFKFKQWKKKKKWNTDWKEICTSFPKMIANATFVALQWLYRMNWNYRVSLNEFYLQTSYLMWLCLWCWNWRTHSFHIAWKIISAPRCKCKTVLFTLF